MAEADIIRKEIVMEKDFFEMITEYFINDRLGDILMQDQEFV